MVAYAVVTKEHTTSEAELEIYAASVPAASAGHRIKVLAHYGDLELLEGEAMEGAVILEFPSMAEAKAWYSSPSYQAALVHRLAGARFRAFFVQGV